jgi:hypothetical protein
MYHWEGEARDTINQKLTQEILPSKESLKSPKSD